MLAKLNDTDHTLFLGDKQIAQGLLNGKVVYETPIPYSDKITITLWAIANIEDGAGYDSHVSQSFDSGGGASIHAGDNGGMTGMNDQLNQLSISFTAPIQSITVKSGSETASGSISGNTWNAGTYLSNYKTWQINAVLKRPDGILENATLSADIYW